MISRDHLLLGPGSRDATGSYRTDSANLPQAIRLRLDDVEHLVAEGAQELLGIGEHGAALQVSVKNCES